MTRVARLLVSMGLAVVIPACQSVPEDRESWMLWTSLVTLLAHPAEFDNIHVRTMGFLADMGGPVLFLTRDHARAQDIASGIPLRLPDEQIASLRKSSCFDKFVYVAGRFAVEQEYVGKTIKVQKISDAFTTRTCWRGD